MLKPKHLTPAPKDADVNYLVDISTKWYRNYFYFCATYCSPGPYAIASSFETQFARLEYVGDQQFICPICGTRGNGGSSIPHYL